MITINPKKVGLIFLCAVVLPAIFGFIFFTRYNYIPVQLTIGECRMDYTAMPTYDDRLSPLESHSFKIRGWEMLVCYGQPALRGRKIIGDKVPYNQLWRMGANEPTRFYTTADIEMGGLVLPKGRYSMYAIPGRFDWEIFVSRSITHWGNDINAEVRSKEVGSFKIKPNFLQQPVELLTIRTEVPKLGENTLDLFFEWEQTQLVIPITNLEVEDKTDTSLKGLINEYTKEAEESKDKSEFEKPELYKDNEDDN
ncbi:MAG: DUF2911 domain-containing protein [Balneolaceae bacterium]|nr:DUF2911 domain-containing protein [Balneolaceae bacterium]